VSVHLTRIYTKTGDDGTTALGDMSRVSKTDARVAAYADCDEANASIGVALALGSLPSDVAAVLRTVQNDLFDVGADLATPVTPGQGRGSLRVLPEYTARLENWCDQYNAELGKLDSFILPGVTAGAALLHQSRTLVRRAERSGWALYAADPNRANREALTYLNRLSDLLFILARVANPEGDVPWKPGGER
jgi:cob(I)alamin adenosyltransferase